MIISEKPLLVFVDYLQILSADSSDSSQNDRKTKTDVAVTTLKSPSIPSYKSIRKKRRPRPMYFSWSLPEEGHNVQLQRNCILPAVLCLYSADKSLPYGIVFMIIPHHILNSQFNTKTSASRLFITIEDILGFHHWSWCRNSEKPHSSCSSLSILPFNIRACERQRMSVLINRFRAKKTPL